MLVCTVKAARSCATARAVAGEPPARFTGRSFTVWRTSGEGWVRTLYASGTIPRRRPSTTVSTPSRETSSVGPIAAIRPSSTRIAASRITRSPASTVSANSRCSISVELMASSGAGRGSGPGSRRLLVFRATPLRQPDLRVDETVGRDVARSEVRVDRVQPLRLEDRQDLVDHALEPLHVEVAEGAVRAVLDKAELLLGGGVVGASGRGQIPERVQLRDKPFEQCV